MFKFIDKHPFVAGFITGLVGVGVVGRALKRIFRGKITVIHLNINDIPTNLNFGEDKTCGDCDGDEEHINSEEVK